MSHLNNSDIEFLKTTMSEFPDHHGRELTEEESYACKSTICYIQSIVERRNMLIAAATGEDDLTAS
jgi:hypothetical protein